MNNNSLENVRNLSAADKEKLAKAFLEMYEGLVRTNLGQDKTLGQSMYNAMTHQKNFVESKKSNDVATIYLRQIQAFYAVQQSQQSMTDENRDKKKQFANDAERDEFKRAAEQKTNGGIKTIDSMIAEFQRNMEKTKTESSKTDTAKPIMKTAQENRDQLPKTPATTPRAPQHGPQMPVSKLASAKELPMQNPHTAESYGAAKPRTAFKNATAKIQMQKREFENIKKLQQMLALRNKYQNAA